MNEPQREQLRKAQLEISKQARIIEQVRDDNQQSYENLSEGLQNAEKGQEMQQAVDDLSEVLANLEEADGTLSQY